MGGENVKRGGSADVTDHSAGSVGSQGCPSEFEQGSADERKSNPGLLIVIDSRDFVRGCIASWLGNWCGEFVTVPVPNFDPSLLGQALEQAAAVLIGVNSAENDCDWLNNQIEGLRAERVELPIILIVEPHDVDKNEALVHQLAIQGYIPTSSTLAVAAAALRLIVAGGHYFPATREASSREIGIEANLASVARYSISAARLTRREEAVLSVLAKGAQNKIIAHQLSMSLSTVKAHVHSIIQKLKVRNRTEAVVAARNMRLAEPEDDTPMAAPNVALRKAVTGRIQYEHTSTVLPRLAERLSTSGH